MRAWTVDADDIRVVEDFDETLLHRTPEIDNFLSLDRDDKFIVIGTKGFGKTLLLKAKRILYQRKTRAVCLPTSNLLDKPIGDKIFGKDALAFFAESSLPWSKLWLTAIATATLKHVDQTDGLEVNPRLARLLADAPLRSVIDHFVRLLDFAPSDLLRTANDTDGHLVPRLRALNTPVAIFIDGVDEYFNKHIETARSRASVAGELSPDIWHFAQLGLVEVAYQLRRINHHLKVFAAIRKEAYARLQTTVMGQQYRGSAVDIVYPVESLREIFVNNIRLEKADRMVRPERLRADPIEAFLGRTTLTHTYTGVEEEAFDYVCRHTLLRLPGHILTRAEVENLFRDHTTATGAVEPQHVFCALYRVGLLGHVRYDSVRGEEVQRFLRPGEGPLARDGVLPQATRYLVHPVLSDVIGHVNPPYLERIDRVNVVGYGRPWQDTASADRSVTARMLCVLAADVHAFGELMRAGNDAPVREALEEALRTQAKGAVCAELGGGDA